MSASRRSRAGSVDSAGCIIGPPVSAKRGELFQHLGPTASALKRSSAPLQNVPR
jgi:hypothetical protein